MSQPVTIPQMSQWPWRTARFLSRLTRHKTEGARGLFYCFALMTWKETRAVVEAEETKEISQFR